LKFLNCISNKISSTFLSVLVLIICNASNSYAGTSTKQSEGERATQKRSLVLISAATNELGLGLLNEKRTSSEADNLMLSPWGIANTLGVLHSATGTQTSSEIGFSFFGRIYKKDTLGNQIKSLNSQLHSDQSNVIFKNANRLWVAKPLTETIKPTLINELHEFYSSDATPFVTNEPAAASEAINSWVSQATAGHIPTIVSEQNLSKNVKAVGVNAVYFNGEWLKPFVQSDNRLMNFKTRAGEILPIPAMIGTFTLKISDQPDFSVIEIPFKNQNYEMIILLPNENESAEKILRDKLSGSSFVDFVDNGKSTEVTLELPKFKVMPVAEGMKSSLASLGISQIFNQGADFSPLTGSASLSVDDIYHAAGIRVDETGVEAKSSSAAVITAKSLKLDAKKISINRPFLFALIHRATATTLFIGYMGKPEF
jgi:serpin B